MGTQLSLPPYWPRNVSWSDAKLDLAQLRKDKLDAKVEIRQVLGKYGERHGIEFDEVSRQMEGYVDNLLDDLFYERENEILDGIPSEVPEDTDQGGW
jgi:hypothetical protein